MTRKQGRASYHTFDRAIEIIEGGEESEPIALSVDERAFFGRDARALGDHDIWLYFFSDATYVDTFGRRHTVVHDFLYSAHRCHLIGRRETTDGDQDSA